MHARVVYADLGFPIGPSRTIFYLQHRESFGMTPQYKGNTFHRPALIGVALLATGLFAATVHADDYTKTFTISNRANVHVDTGDGSVVVTTSDTKEVEFRVEYQGYVLEKSLHIESNQHGDEVELRGAPPASGRSP